MTTAAKMMSLADQMAAHGKQRRELDANVLAGTVDAPVCFTCKAPSTHVTAGITPAGYRAYQCNAHTPKKRQPLWGSDPGWQTDYIALEDARQRAAHQVAGSAA